MNSSWIYGFAGLVSMFAVLGSANAATVTCPGSRTFEIGVSATGGSCLLSGEGALSGVPSSDQFLAASPAYSLVDSWPGIGGIADGALTFAGGEIPTGPSGTFEFEPLTNVSDYALGISTVADTMGPDFAVFGLPVGIDGGTFRILNNTQNIATVALYAIAPNAGPSIIPVPASIVLLASGLLGLSLLGIQKR